MLRKAIQTAAIAGILAAVLSAQPAQTLAPDPRAAALEQPDAQRIRSDFSRLLDKYPPALHGALRQDPSLLGNQAAAALENADPALDDAGYRRLLDDALGYLRDERDLRGIEARVGWIHATAHTADLLKFLARDPRFTVTDQVRLLDAAWAKMTAAGTPVFTHAEDERLAAANRS